MATSVDASASLDAGLAQADQKGAADPPNPVPAAEPAEPPKPAKVKHSQHGDLIARCNGVFAVKKPSGTSSADVVARVKGALERQLAAFQASGTHEPVSEGEEPKDSKTQATDGTRGGKRGRRGGKSRRGFQLKVGHGGTLDPMASGLLVIGVGTGTKELSTFLSCTKEYVAGGKFGAATDTYDATGKVVRLAPADPALVNTGTLAAKLEEFRGERLQIPPMYSALWIEGKRLYEYAREGKPLPDGKKVEARKVTVEDVELLAFEPIPEAPTDAAPAHAADSGENVGDDAPAVAPADVKGPTFSVRVVSSGGFYVRSFIHDLGEEFGSSAFMISLQRTRQGKMKLEDALDVSNLDLVKVCDAIEEAKKLK